MRTIHAKRVLFVPLSAAALVVVYGAFLWVLPVWALIPSGNIGDQCSASFASAGYEGEAAECMPVCGQGKTYDASKDVFTSNPCAGYTSKTRCCVGKSKELCQFLAKLGGIDPVKNDVQCMETIDKSYEIITSKTGGGATISNSCPTSPPTQCVKQKPTCAEAVSKIAETKTDGLCAAVNSGLEKDYFIIDSLLKQAKVPFACANTSCWAPKGNGGYFCKKLGELRGIKDAKCYPVQWCSGELTRIVPESDMFGDPCITDYKNFSGSCCSPPPPPSVKGGKAGGAATSTKQAKEPPAVVTKYGLLNPLGTKNVPQIIGQIIAWLGGIAGSLFFAFLLIGGFQWMLARGDATQVKTAQQRIVAAATGIVVVLLAYLIVESLVGVMGFK